ncbi:MAG: hypothetical protein WAQ29_04355 [Nitrososphaeraceae archaeon]
MTHNGIDIDQFILLAVYPTITFFIIGLIGKRLSIGEPLKYAIQASSSIIFAVVYFLAIPNGGAQGLATVLILFGAILFLMARKSLLHTKVDEESPGREKVDEKGKSGKTGSVSSTNESVHSS